MVPTSTSAALSEEIDQLLEHYLSLLDQYSTLRSQLSSIQSSVFQNISRANFTAERGIRYGADLYDARMQTTRVCCITVSAVEHSATGGPALQDTVVVGKSLDDVEPVTATEVDRQDKPSTTATVAGTACFSIAVVPQNAPPLETERADGDEKEGGETKRRKDPLRMFGLLTPSTLREAQRRSIQTVEQILPGIASVDAEMKEVEIRIRRARKWRAKAEAREVDLTEKRTQVGQRVEVEV